MSRLLKLLVTIGVIISASPLLAVDAMSVFRLSPASYSISLSSTGQVELEFKLTNDSSDNLEFDVSLADEVKETLKLNGVGLILVQGAASVNQQNLLTETSKISLPGKSTLPIKTRLMADKALDYQLEIPLQLTQVGGERRLTTSDYNLMLRVNSVIKSTQQSQLNTLVAFGGLAFGIIVILGGIILVRKLRANGKASNQ